MGESHFLLKNLERSNIKSWKSYGLYSLGSWSWVLKFSKLNSQEHHLWCHFFFSLFLVWTRKCYRNNFDRVGNLGIQVLILDISTSNHSQEPEVRSASEHFRISKKTWLKFKLRKSESDSVSSIATLQNYSTKLKRK